MFGLLHAVSQALFEGLLNFIGPTLIKPLVGESEPKKTWLITVNLWVHKVDKYILTLGQCGLDNFSPHSKWNYHLNLLCVFTLLIVAWSERFFLPFEISEETDMFFALFVALKKSIFHLVLQTDTEKCKIFFFLHVRHTVHTQTHKKSGPFKPRLLEALTERLRGFRSYSTNRFGTRPSLTFYL